MIRAVLILCFTLSFASNAEEPRPAIKSAEEAILRFRESREAVLKLALPERVFNAIAPVFSAGYVTVQPMRPADYKPPFRSRLVLDAPSLRIFGSFSAAADSSHPTWRLNYGTASLPGIAIYLDGVTGDILYIHDIPEG
ncbi:MAG TPA: hypothetical protein VF614_13110 [Chthoniobacteraceae bacterium]|jgi:hypothetical protein